MTKVKWNILDLITLKESHTLLHSAMHFLYPRQDALMWLLNRDIFLHVCLTVMPVPWPAAVQEGGLRTCVSLPSFPEVV